MREEKPPGPGALLSSLVLLLVACANGAGCNDAGAMSAEREAAEETPPPQSGEAPLAGEHDVVIEEHPPEPEPLHLPGPSLADWPQRLGPTSIPSLGPQPNDGTAVHVALATAYNAPIFDSPRRPVIIGRVRRGNRVPVIPASGRGCTGGRWYRVEADHGYVCSNEGFEVSGEAPIEYRGRQRQPDVTLPVTLEHGLVITDAAPMLARPPDEEEAKLLDAVTLGEIDPDDLGDLVIRRMIGDYYLTIDEEVVEGGRRYYRTVAGNYARAEDVEPIESHTEMHGEHLGEEHGLPLAFVYVDGTEILCEVEGAPEARVEPCGHAEKYARFDVERVVDEGGRPLVEATGGFFVDRSAVRLADVVERPSRVPPGEKWAHIDLDEQALVAYEGDRPVFATLVSSGREGFATPAGLWRTTRKYITRTMRGGNLQRGIWHVEGVPWAIFYHHGYAVHGAYWHDGLGKVQSRGCTNLAPADARWLFYWSSLPVPPGWHAITARQGTWWYFTRD